MLMLERIQLYFGGSWAMPVRGVADDDVTVIDYINESYHVNVCILHVTHTWRIPCSILSHFVSGEFCFLSVSSDDSTSYHTLPHSESPCGVPFDFSLV